MNYSRKRKYTSPILNVIKLDQEISLVMMTDPPGFPGAPPAPKAAAPSAEKLPEKNPFGGNKPDYSN